MVASLHKWVTRDLQPLAKKRLGTSLIKINVMSDYSCRKAYGRVANKLSEHGHANALDIGSFQLASGEQVAVLKEWGQTKRDLEALIAAAKAAAEKANAERIEAEKKAQANLSDPKAAGDGKPQPTPPAAAGTPIGTPGAGLVKTTIIDGVPKLTITLPGGQRPAGDAEDGMGFAPHRLGGPKADETAAKDGKDAAKSLEPQAKAGAPERAAKKDKSKKDKTIEEPKSAALAPAALPSPVPPSKMGRFLREAHAAACKIFGTTLGPEANNAHRNHFHVDMAERKRSLICD